MIQILETVNDSYLCVCGIPKQNGKRHAGEMVTMCLHLISSCSLQIPSRGITTELQLRLGVHSGPVVAGIVGHAIPKYCLFGESVKIAKLVENSGKANKVVVSEATQKLLKELGNYQTSAYGEVGDERTGKVKTFLVTGKNKFSKPLPPGFYDKKDEFVESGDPTKTLIP